MAVPELIAAASRREEMLVLGARALKGRSTVLVGIGQPNLAAALGKLLYTPELIMLYESGIIDGGSEKLALSIGDPALVKGAAAICSMFELFAYYLGGRRIDAGFVSAAQIGRAGDINTTVIGTYADPTVRLPGSGGASDIALLVDELLVMMPHEKRRFPERVDFVTSSAGRSMTVITDLATLVMSDGELVVTAIRRGVTRDQVRAETGWAISFTDPLGSTPLVTADELAAVRRLDRDGLYS
jgi:glutaconate CoA-transferase, subunit B